MPAVQSRLLLLPTELFPIVAGHFPLYAAPRNLLSLALTNKEVASIILPVLYSHLILKDEPQALAVIRAILADPAKGSLVRGIHIRSKLSPEVRNDPNGLDVIKGLERLVTMGALPLIYTLEVHLEDNSWWTDLETHEGFTGFGVLRENFWKGVKEKCPRVHTLVLTNIGDAKPEELMNSGLFDIEGIRNLTLRFSLNTLDEAGNQRLFKTITNLAPNLRTLNFAANAENDDWMELTPFFDLDFPVLESLTLYGQCLNDTEASKAKAQAFWERHSKLEYLNLNHPDETPRFERCIEGGAFLPKLKHLVAPFRDVRTLAPVLHQLVSLTVLKSVNAQVPYLLRAVVPSGTLPSLQSLNIVQTDVTNRASRESEGAFWYETPEGEFKEGARKGKKKFRRTVFDEGYMLSIVKGAPRLKELAIQDPETRVSNYTDLLPDLAKFDGLQRFFYREKYQALSDLDTPEKVDEFKAQARLAGEACPSLEEVGDIYADPPAGNVTARILRDSDADKTVRDVEVVIGNGMVVGQEDQAFPRSNERSTV